MLNDPLIPNPPTSAGDFPGNAEVAPAAQTSSRATSRTMARTPRAKHPAMSARILATGLAATGMLGLTAGYALGEKPDDSAPVLDNFLPTAADAQVSDLPGAAPQQPTEQVSPQLPPNGRSQAPQQRVIQVPVQPPSGAVAGNGAGSGNWGGGPTQQQSSGSN